ncbi:sensor histidine kinase [Pleomorphovibrio marinus]|uniref:sensor histidine kinase n=1 Tax=Pleomorphovibrio marinus TaxID=2164132 RepID=UPI000E0C5189|nr:ATP-binding protein [Pleomorphovibrio marinus]
MEGNPKDQERRKFDRLRWRYLIALSAIALTVVVSQVFLQHFISGQQSDSIEINLSGRQRMLSQKISKLSLLIFYAQSQKERISYREELQVALEEWERVFYGLQDGDQELGIKGQNSPPIDSLFQEITPAFLDVMQGAEEMIRQIGEVEDGNVNRFSEPLSLILDREGVFLEGMNQIVANYDLEARSKVFRLKRVEFLLMFLALFIIFVEARFIFWPSALMIKENFRELQKKEKSARKMAIEISALYESLERSYQELVAVEPEEDEYVIFGRCDSEGAILELTDKFRQIMAFEDNAPKKIFTWLEEQGNEAAYLKVIHEKLLHGQSWKGELKLTNEAGDFIWVKMHLIPTLTAAGAVSNFLLVGMDETEAKEAKVRSQEVQKERLEKKLKEQQYRSALILEGQEEERRRISRDMHDGVGQYLTALKYSLDGVYTTKSIPEKKRLETSKELLKNVIKEVRRISFNLAPVALSDYGIVSVLQKFSEEMSKLSKIPVSFENKTGFISRLEPKIENNLYRIAQEAVNNAIKYSEASEIKISLSHSMAYLNLEIKDNGKGFNYEKLKDNGYFSASGHGIFNIKERVNFINGQLTVDTGPERGTAIQVVLPLES